MAKFIYIVWFQAAFDSQILFSIQATNHNAQSSDLIHYNIYSNNPRLVRLTELNRDQPNS